MSGRILSLVFGLIKMLIVFGLQLLTGCSSDDVILTSMSSSNLNHTMEAEMIWRIIGVAITVIILGITISWINHWLDMQALKNSKAKGMR